MKDEILRLLKRKIRALLASKGGSCNFDDTIYIKVNPIKGLFINAEKLCKELNNEVFDPGLTINDVIVSGNKMTVFYSYSFA